MRLLVAIIAFSVTVSCWASRYQESGSASPAVQDRIEITVAEVCEVLRAGGLPLTSSVSEIPIDPWHGTFEVPGLVSKAVAVTAVDSTDVTIEIFDSEGSRAVEQQRRSEGWERLRASREPGTIPALIAPAACGSILVQVSSGAAGIQQRRQVLAILNERFGPCD